MNPSDQRTEGPPPGGIGAILGLERLEMLRSDLGTPTVDEMVADFLREMPERLAELRRQAADGAWDAAEFGLHSLKGAGASLGLDALAATLKAAEQMVVEGGARPVGPLLADLDRLVGLSLAAFARWKDERPKTGEPAS